MAVPAWLDDAAGFATCATLLTAGSSLVGTGVSTLWAGGGGLVPLSLGMLSYLGAGYACQPTPVDGEAPLDGVDGCQQLGEGEYGWLQVKNVGEDFVDVFPSGNFIKANQVNEILAVEVIPLPELRPPEYRKQITWRTTDGNNPYTVAAYFTYYTEEEARKSVVRIRPLEGQSCVFGTDDPRRYPDGFNDPIQYTDPTTNCTYNITPQGFVQESEGGEVGLVFKVEAAGPASLASGGVVGGCNFEPTIVYQSPNGGPPSSGPWDPTWPNWDGGGDPPWKDIIAGLAAGASTSLINYIIQQMFETQYLPGTRSIYAACNYKQDGSPETFSVTFPQENYQQRVLTSLDAIVDFQQQILLWRTPTCSGGGQSVTGEAVSINWVSDEYSPNGNNRIRKLLTYFDQVGSTLEQTVAHWKDFTWQAGPVIVSCVGTPLGKPQVWANSIDEAKRVIGHAAAIAGVDLADAEWQVAPPKSSRYGMAGLMRVHRSSNGTLGITKRDGPSGLPPALT